MHFDTKYNYTKITIAFFHGAGLKRKYKRIKKDCPIPECNSRQLAKLADHLHYVHQIKDKSIRKKWLNKAKQVFVQLL